MRIFEPTFTRDAAHRRLIDELLDLFGSSFPSCGVSPRPRNFGSQTL